MKHFKWQHIVFKNGSNPYICTSEREFKKIKRKYILECIKEGFWIVLGTRKKERDTA